MQRTSEISSVRSSPYLLKNPDNIFPPNLHETFLPILRIISVLFWVASEAQHVQFEFRSGCSKYDNLIRSSPTIFLLLFARIHTFQIIEGENMVWRREGLRRWRNACVILWSGGATQVTPRRGRGGYGEHCPCFSCYTGRPRIAFCQASGGVCLVYFKQEILL